MGSTQNKDSEDLIGIVGSVGKKRVGEKFNFSEIFHEQCIGEV